jgi:formylglycine-generating enzyme required for sulfatase activity
MWAFLAALLSVLFLVGSADLAASQTQADMPAAARIALVIGNGDYADAKIENAAADARSVADVLRSGGFKVIYLENAKKEEIRDAIRLFGNSLENGSQAVIFYAGHAIQYQNRNYLVAIDSQISQPDDVRASAVDLDLVFDPLIVSRTRGSVVILDASHENPWQSLLPGNLKGLARQDAAANISLICATQPGRVTPTSGRAASAFAASLVQAMGVPDIGFDAVVTRLRASLAKAIRDQSVWLSSPAPSSLVVLSSKSQSVADTKPADETELGFWDTIKNSETPADFETYLYAYPEGRFALLAKSRLAQLKGQQSASGEKRDQAGQSDAPLKEAQKEEKQEAASQTIRDCEMCPELVLIPAGSFTMGSTESFAFEGPVHDVSIRKDFYIGRREVTFDEWDACIADGGCQYRPGDRGQGRGLRAVSDLDWNDAKTYLDWLSRKTGKTYRLPTEAEWEYAARGGTKTTYYWGNALEQDRANCVGCTKVPLGKVIETGTFAPNPFGLYDMAGNAAEWVEDCWAENYKNAPKDGTAFDKPNCRERVLRGGSFNNDARFVRSASRFKYDFDVRYYANGFRVVREK